MTTDGSLLGPPTKADAAYLELRNQILQGKLVAGTRVDLAVLANSFGLSITPLREALRRLEANQLVVRNAHRDVVIAPLSRQEAIELWTVREELEVLAARLASTNMTEEEIEVAARMIRSKSDRAAVEYLSQINTSVSCRGQLAINQAFHNMIYRGSHNRVLLESLVAIAARAERYALRAEELLAERGTPYPRAHVHDEIVAAIRKHDGVGAERAMRDHFRAGATPVDVIFGSSVPKH